MKKFSTFETTQINIRNKQIKLYEKLRLSTNKPSYVTKFQHAPETIN